MKCDRCGKEMMDKDGTTYSGIQIQLFLAGGNMDKEIFYQKQLGKYKLDYAYKFCFECTIDSLMGK